MLNTRETIFCLNLRRSFALSTRQHIVSHTVSALTSIISFFIIAVHEALTRTHARSCLRCSTTAASAGSQSSGKIICNIKKKQFVMVWHGMVW